MVTPELVLALRYEGESDALDFKSNQYLFAGATDDEKSELLKDVLALANSWRRTDAFILVGVQEVKGAPAELVGITSHLDDANLQQFINSKTQRPLRFAYSTVEVDGKALGVVHIPIQERPFFLVRKFGALDPNVVYVRRGSSTAIANPDEIARMGRVESEDDDIDLDLFLADPRSRKRMEGSLLSHVLSVPPRSSIPDYHRRSEEGLVTSYGWGNSNYYRELTAFTKVNRLLSPVWLAIENKGTATALDVRIEIVVPGADGGVHVRDEDEYPSVPRDQHDPMFMPMRPVTYRIDTSVDRVEDEWLISARTDKVQPKSTVWLRDPVYIGAEASRVLECAARVSADNLRAPHEQVLAISIQATQEEADLKRILELEDDRIERSPVHREILRRLEEE